MHYSEICRNNAEKIEPLPAGLFHPQSAFMPSTNPSIDYLNFHLSNSSYASDTE